MSEKIKDKEKIARILKESQSFMLLLMCTAVSGHVSYSGSGGTHSGTRAF